MGFMKIEHHIEKTYTITENNVVGPTSNTTYRNNIHLPWPNARSNGSPDFNTINVDNDANTIYVNPVAGNDANTGTDLSSDAVLTIGRAWALASATRHTIHIEASGGATEWTLTQEWNTIANNTNVIRIQCAAGQTGTITTTGHDSDGPYPPAASGNLREISGIHFVYDLPGGGAGATAGVPLRAAGVTALVAKWCSFRSNLTDRSTSNYGLGLFGNDSSVTVQYCKFIMTTHGGVFLNTTTINGIDLTYCIFDGSEALSEFQDGAFTVNKTVANPCNINHCVFYRITSALHTVTNGAVWSLHSNIFHDVKKICHPGGNLTTAMTLTNSLINVVDTDTGNVTVSSATNRIGPDPLFINELTRDFRLRHIGRLSPDGITYYPSNSPAVGIGLSDAGAYSVTYALATDTSRTFQLIKGDGYSISARKERSDYAAFQAITSKHQHVWTDFLWFFELEFDGNYWHGFPQTAAFHDLFSDRGLLRYYPKGDLGLWNGGVSCTPSSLTQISTGSNLPSRTLPDASVVSGSNQSIPNWLNGWVMKITWTDGVAKAGYFEIVSHTATVWTLLHLRGDFNILSGSNFVANVLYLPCHVTGESLDVPFDYVIECDDNPTSPFHPQGAVSIEDTYDQSPNFRRFTLAQTKERPES